MKHKRDVKICVSNLVVKYHGKTVLQDVSLDIVRGQTTVLIGPSGCGKSTFLRCLNRMNDDVPGIDIQGHILIDGEDITRMDVTVLRTRVGMLFQKPTPFAKTIYENVAYGPRIHSLCRTKAELDEVVIQSLKGAGLWSEVEKSLHEPASRLSGGQQQRLCLARALAVNPEVILMDEPTSALDPIATAKVEELMDELSSNMTLVVVTHNLQQAARVSDQVAFFSEGRLIEVRETLKFFTNPQCPQTQAYLMGRHAVKGEG